MLLRRQEETKKKEKFLAYIRRKGVSMLFLKNDKFLEDGSEARRGMPEVQMETMLNSQGGKDGIVHQGGS